MRRICRVKKPWFCVANDGYPPLPIFLMRADSHTTWFPLEPGKAVEGLDRPLVLMSRPGLLHPPAGRGDGLRERDIWKPGVPVPWRVKRLAVCHGRREAGGWLRPETGTVVRDTTRTWDRGELARRLPMDAKRPKRRGGFAPQGYPEAVRC